MGDNRAMSEPLIEGPGPPKSAPSAPEQRVSGLIPFVHVEDVQRSIDFYYHLGFTLASVYKYRGTPIWADLQSEEAALMVTTDGDPIDPAGQGGAVLSLFARPARAAPAATCERDRRWRDRGRNPWTVRADAAHRSGWVCPDGCADRT